MTYPYSKILSSVQDGPHKFTTYELEYPHDKEEFLSYILPVLKEEYGISGKDIELKMSNLSEDKSKNISKFLQKYNTANPAKGAPAKSPWLKNTRSKLPEIISRDILRKLDGVTFPCRYSLEDDPDMPKRGVDGLGFVFEGQDDNVALKYIVSSEVKASEEKESPPSSVHKNHDSMFISLKSLANFDERLKKSLASAIDVMPAGQFIELVFSIVNTLEENETSEIEELKKKVIVVPFLLRKREFWSEKDYGKFRTDHAEFTAAIRYYILTLGYSMSEFADEIYEKLRAD